MSGTRKLVKRSDKVMFMKVPGEVDTICRMTGFTGLTTSKNPIEYSRRYVDEAFEQTDVTGMSPSVDFSFDRYNGDPVHDYLVSLIDSESIGSDAVVSLYLVDLSSPSQLGEGVVYPCTCRDFALIPSKEGGESSAYTYSGTFKVKGGRVEGTAVLSADSSSITFTKK